MTDRAHAPAPWTTSYGWGTSITTSTGGKLRQSTERPLAERQANARLVAAAPELATALDAALRWIGRLDDWSVAGDPDLDAWQRTLANARGED